MKHLAILFAAGLLGEQTALAQTSATVEHEQLSFAFGDFTAGAQLDYPADVAQAPVVVLIPGSGPEDRNADIGTSGQPPSSHIFLDIADALTARGFAVMRYCSSTAGARAAREAHVRMTPSALQLKHITFGSVAVAYDEHSQRRAHAEQDERCSTSE